MPEEIAQASQEASAETQHTELADMMAIAGVIPPSEKTQETPAATQEPLADVVPITIPFDTLKEKFGYQAPEDVEKEILELRALKANPPAAENQKFENEDSEKLFKAWKAGKNKEVYGYLHKQIQLDELASAVIGDENAEDVIKLAMQLQSPDLTPAEINFKFNKQFANPRKPVQSDVETDDEYAEREAAWKEQVEEVRMSKIIDAKQAKPVIEAAKSKLVPPQIEEAVDEGYAQYRKNIEQGTKAAAEANEAYKKFTPKDFVAKMNFNDEANKITFEFQHEPTSERFAETLELVSDMEKFFGKFKSQDGSLDRKKFFDTIHRGLNFEEYLLDGMNQAKNAAIKSFLPDNSQGGMLRQMPQQQEGSELDTQMKAALKGYGSY